MGEAAFWGLISASSLLVGAGVAFGFNLSRRWIGLIMGFGVGTLISAVAFELVVPAIEDSSVAITSIALLVGALTFFVGDWAIDHFGGEHRKSSEGKQEGGSGTSIVLGTVLDGIPESMVLGMTIAIDGAVSVALLAGIWLSNFPESLGASVGLEKSGWARSKITLMWLGIVVVATASAVIGFAIVDVSSGRTGAAVSAFAAGALLTMIADTMAPEAFEKSGRATGLATALGFVLAVGLTGLEI